MSEENKTCGAAADCPFSDEAALEKIAEKAAEKAIEKLTNHVYQEIGRSVISKFVYIVGAATLAGWLWLKSKGIVS